MNLSHSGFTQCVLIQIKTEFFHCVNIHCYSFLVAPYDVQCGVLSMNFKVYFKVYYHMRGILEVTLFDMNQTRPFPFMTYFSYKTGIRINTIQISWTKFQPWLNINRWNVSAQKTRLGPSGITKRYFDTEAFTFGLFHLQSSFLAQICEKTAHFQHCKLSKLWLMKWQMKDKKSLKLFFSQTYKVYNHILTISYSPDSSPLHCCK